MIVDEFIKGSYQSGESFHKTAIIIRQVLENECLSTVHGLGNSTIAFILFLGELYPCSILRNQGTKLFI